jgi:hypothetical protein
MKKLITVGLFGLALASNTLSATPTISTKKKADDTKSEKPLVVGFGFNYIDPYANENVQDLSLKGFTLNGGYEFYLPNNLSTTSKLQFNYGRTSDRFLGGRKGETEISSKQVSLQQSLAYNYGLGENVVRPFLALGLGMGWVDLEFSPNNTNSRVETKGNKFFYSLGTGVEYELKNGIVPFMMMAYQKFDVDSIETETEQNGEVKTEVNELNSANEYEMGGLLLTVGVSYKF